MSGDQPANRSTVHGKQNMRLELVMAVLVTPVLTQPQWCDQPPDLGQFLKPTLP
jgi:hypothetical protein